MTPYDDRKPSQHCLRQWLGSWWRQAITCTNVDLSSVDSYNNHPRAISHAIHQLLFHDISLNAWLKFSLISQEQWVNSLWPRDVNWRQGSGSTLAQVMACCLTTPSHYLSQCWLVISEVLWHSPDRNFTENTQDIYCWNDFQIYYLGP